METKLIRDPIYGYLNIPLDLMNKVVDTATFQRLRRIMQTSYSPLFASSIHNRFIHSFGVYHLGTIASSSLVKALLSYKITCDGDGITEEEKAEKDAIKRLEYIFLLACLLHDVGHAPFSHTGEDFFLDEASSTSTNKYATLHETLCEVVGTESMKADIPNGPQAAAAHELMSAIVGIRQFGDLFASNEEREFFARCITGYRYVLAGEDKEKQSIKNCFISLLNSKVIDVDRLDYLIRDAYFTGFDTVSIDYRRLLTALTVIQKSVSTDDWQPAHYEYELAYYKGAISVIENVVFAHDAERKWIQLHPAVQYENYIIQRIIAELHKYYMDKGIHLFSEDALSYTGCTLDDGTCIRLLCDDDVISLMKRIIPNDPLSEEYFERRNRPRPLWKTEAEYHNLEMQYASQDGAKKLGETLKNIENHIRKHSSSWVINDESIETFKSYAATEAKQAKGGTLRAEEELKKDKNNNIIKVMDCLQACFRKNNIPCSCIILNSSQFSSGFSRPDFANINLLFPPTETPRRFREVVTGLESKSNERKDFFYLFIHVPVPYNDQAAKLKSDLREALFKLF